MGWRRLPGVINIKPMKTTRVLTSIFAFVGLIGVGLFYLSNSRPSNVPQPITTGVAETSHRSSVPAVHNMSPSESMPVIKKIPASDRDVLEAGGFSKQTLAAVDLLVNDTRKEVMAAFARYAKVESLDENGLMIKVVLPRNEMVSMRENFHTKLKALLGPTYEDYTRLQNITRLEARMDYFGQYPIIYEATGDGKTLHESKSIRYRTNVAGETGTSYWVGHYTPLDLKKYYGPIGELVLANK